MFIGFIIFFVGMGGWFVDEQIHPCDYPRSSAYESAHCADNHLVKAPPKEDR